MLLNRSPKLLLSKAGHGHWSVTPHASRVHVPLNGFQGLNGGSLPSTGSVNETTRLRTVENSMGAATSSRCLRSHASHRFCAMSGKPASAGPRGTSGTPRCCATRCIEARRVRGSTVWRRMRAYKSRKSRHRVLALPRASAVTIFSASTISSGRARMLNVPVSNRGSCTCCGSGQMGSPTLMSTCRRIVARDSVPPIVTRTPLHGGDFTDQAEHIRSAILDC